MRIINEKRNASRETVMQVAAGSTVPGPHNWKQRTIRVVQLLVSVVQMLPFYKQLCVLHLVHQRFAGKFALYSAFGILV